MAIEFPIEDTNLSSGPGTNFRNMDRPTKSGSEPNTKVFIGVNPLEWAIADKKGRNREGGVTPPGYNHELALRSIEIQVIVGRPGGEVVNILLQIKKHTVLIEVGGGEKENTRPQRLYQRV